MVSCCTDNRLMEKKENARNSIMCKCNLPNCVPTQKLKYVQPARPPSFKPIRHYTYPAVKMDADTVYKSSFQCMDPCLIKISRPPPVLPLNQLRTNQASIQKDTVTKLSFPGYYQCEKQQPILPNNSKLLGQGPMLSLTTQKHDFVFKTANKRNAILPSTHIEKPCGPMEKETIQKLSFPIPCNEGPPKSFKPIRYYTRPDVKMESDTVNKLSFLPLCINKREIPPWAKKPMFQKPTTSMNKDTTYTLSFLSNCNDLRPKMVVPVNNLSTNKCKGIDPHTIYKESYFCDVMPQRTIPILPRPNLSLPCDGRIPNDTVYKLSFPIHCSYERQKPILPNSCQLLGKGPVQSLTTQKHDFYCKPLSKLDPIRPRANLEKACGPMEKETTMKLSYQCNNKENYVMLKSFKPERQYVKPEIPMECFTTQKLSFLPVDISPKEQYPWARKAKFQPPTVKMESETTQRLSYIPPGQFISDHDCPCLPNENSDFTNAPRAGIC